MDVASTIGRRTRSALAALAIGAVPAAACDTALVLAIDVSNSVDTGEYRLQIDGLANALLDADIAHALVTGRVALTVVQWSGHDAQQQSIPWQRMTTRADVVAFSAEARALERAYIGSNTAPGDAVRFSLGQFEAVAECTRKVIDVSGDGAENAGSPTQFARRAAELAGVEINGIAIESLGLSITGFFRRALITRGGFVLTARGHRDYARAIREKIRREVVKVSG